VTDEGRPYDSGSLHRDMGRLEGRMDAMETQQGKLEVWLGKIDGKLDALTNTWLTGKGMLKMLATLATVVAFASGVAMWAVTEYRDSQVKEATQEAVEDTVDSPGAQ